MNEKWLWRQASLTIIIVVIIGLMVDKKIKKWSNLIFKHRKQNFPVSQGDAAGRTDREIHAQNRPNIQPVERDGLGKSVY